MDTLHLQNVELELQHQKYKRRVLLRREKVDDDSGVYTVFTEQGSSASQLTSVKLMDVVARFLGWCTNRPCCIKIHWGKDGGCFRFLKIACLNVHVCEYVFYDTECQSWWSHEDPVVPHETIVRTSACRLLVGKTIGEVSLGTLMDMPKRAVRKVVNWQRRRKQLYKVSTLCFVDHN